MKVVKVNPDRSVEVLGHCDNHPHLRPGDYIRVVEPLWSEPFALLPSAGFNQTLRAGIFKIIPLMEGRSRLPDAVEVTTDSPPVEWLPGWRPIRRIGD